MQTPLHILLVEDSPTDALLTEEALSGSPFAIECSERLEDALRRLATAQFDVILLDLGLPDSQGLDTLRTLRRKNRHIPIVVLTGKNDEQLALQALKEGAQDYQAKSELQGHALRRTIRYAVERSNSEKLLRQSEDRVRELTAHIHQVLWVIDAKEFKILYISPAYEEMWGRSCQSLIDNPQSYMEGIHPLDFDMMLCENEAMYATGRIDVETRIRRPDQTVRWVWIRGYPVTEAGRIVRLVGVIEDITDKRRLAEERDTLLARLQLHIERLPLAYILFDADFLITDWNPAAERIFGYTRAEMIGVGPPYRQFVPPSFWGEGDAIRSRIRHGDMTAHSINENLAKDGRSITCEWYNTPLVQQDGQFTGILCLAQDVTGRKTLEAQLQQAQKMEAVGQLAGGVAHDFNNLLTIISGYSEILLGSLEQEDPMYESINAINESSWRAAALTRQLLAFSRKSVLEPRVLDLNNIVRETEKLLRRMIGEDIQISLTLDPSISQVKVDPGQFGQVLMNLAVNSRDACPKGES